MLFVDLDVIRRFGLSAIFDYYQLIIQIYEFYPNLRMIFITHWP
jgi:hypothetical protein